MKQIEAERFRLVTCLAPQRLGLYGVGTVLAATVVAEVGNDPVYVKTTCFETFPFPDATEAQKATIRDLGEALDRHRWDRLAEHPDLTMTGMYNVLEKLRSSEELIPKEREVHGKGLVSILKELHDELDNPLCQTDGCRSIQGVS